MARNASTKKTVRLGRDGQLWAIWEVTDHGDVWLAGLLTEENRALYLSWSPEWTIIGGGERR